MIWREWAEWVRIPVMAELFKKLLKTDTHLPKVIYTSYKVYVKYIHLSLANEKPGIPGQQVHRGITFDRGIHTELISSSCGHSDAITQKNVLLSFINNYLTVFNFLINFLTSYSAISIGI